VVDWGVSILRRLAAVGVVAALLLCGGCESTPKQKKHQVLYSVDLTQPDDVTAPVYYLGAGGVQSVVATFPWSTSVTLDDEYLPSLQLRVNYFRVLEPDPHFHCVISVDGKVMDEHYGIGTVECDGKSKS
jgi:hypothetical protein